MQQPDISVVIPSRNEGPRLPGTIQAISRARTTDARVEFVIADDASTDDTEGHLRAATRELLREPRIDIKVSRLEKRRGVPGTRNHAASLANGEILFITDAHVRFSRGWDAAVFDHLKPNRVLAGSITEENTPFVGYGCRLVVPFMGTYWNKEKLKRPAPVQIAACPATVIERKLFQRLGGYDPGMYVYGAAEPEFSVRAWLHGAQVLIVPEIQVQHRFKPKAERMEFLGEVRPFMVHNSIRFGLLYLSDHGSLQMLRYYSRKFPQVFQAALKMVAESDVWRRKAVLERQRRHTFEWFVRTFKLKNQIGGEIL